MGLNTVCPSRNREIRVIMPISIHEKTVQIERVPAWGLKQSKVLSEEAEYIPVEISATDTPESAESTFLG